MLYIKEPSRRLVVPLFISPLWKKRRKKTKVNFYDYRHWALIIINDNHRAQSVMTRPVSFHFSSSCFIISLDCTTTLTCARSYSLQFNSTEWLLYGSHLVIIFYLAITQTPIGHRERTHDFLFGRFWPTSVIYTFRLEDTVVDGWKDSTKTEM